MQYASRQPLEGYAALSVLEGVTELFVARGRSVLHFDLERAPLGDAELLGLLLGRSGKLRAPAIRTGSRLLVGYTDELLATTLL